MDLTKLAVALEWHRGRIRQSDGSADRRPRRDHPQTMSLPSLCWRHPNGVFRWHTRGLDGRFRTYKERTTKCTSQPHPPRCNGKWHRREGIHDMSDTGIIDDTHLVATVMDVHQVARALTDALGPTLVAVLAGVRDSKLPHKWAKPDGPEPRDSSQRRLRTAYRVWESLVDKHNRYIARAWFIGLNPLLDETPPVVALGEGRDREVIEAARAFISDERVT